MNTETNFKKGFNFILSKFMNMKISMKLAVSYLLTVIVCILIMTVFFYSQIKFIVENRVNDILSNTLKQSMNNINYKIELYNRLVNMIYADANLQDLLVESYEDAEEKYEVKNRLLNQLKPSTFTGYTDLSSFNLYMNNKTIPQYDEYVRWTDSISGEKWYEAIENKNDNVYWLNMDEVEEKISDGERQEGIGDIQDETRNGNLMVVRKLRHLSFNKFIGILKLEIDKEKFFESLKENSKREDEWFEIVDIERGLIYSSRSSEDSKLDQLGKHVYENCLEAEQGYFLEKGRKNLDIYYDTIDYTRWKIIYAVPTTAYSEMIRSLQLTIVLIVFVCIVAFVIISGFLASKLTSKIRELSKSMLKIQNGNFDVSIPYNGKDELGQFIHGFNMMAKNLKELIEEVYATEVKEKELELKLLQAQINPHFLYNTLASISWLGMRSEEKDIYKMSNSLAKFYKLSLSKGKNVIKAKDEIGHVKAYMDIQGIRFKNKITMVYDIDDEVLEADSLKLIVQPFIENAILHGLWADKAHITIKLQVNKEGQEVIWKIIDDGVGIGREKLKTLEKLDENEAHGYGIVNVDQRIKLHFGDNYGIRIFSRLGIGTVVIINTPFN